MKKIWLERAIALVVLLNLLLVIFDLSYIPARNFYFIYLRQGDRAIVTDFYDPIKGIESHRDTQKYLAQAEEIKQKLLSNNPDVFQAETTQKSLNKIRRLSELAIDDNPFAESNQLGLMEKIKDRMRKHIGNQSAKESFRIFWSSNYLNVDNVKEEINFYDNKIKPLLALNYFRHRDESGNFVDYFWRIDIWFIGFFTLEFLIRTWAIARRYTSVSWLDAMLWRWYDIFFLLPFWRWLRIIPLVIRLNQARIIDLYRLKKQISQGFVASIAEDLTELIFVRIINQLQTVLGERQITNFLSNTNSQPYLDLNNINESAEIARILLQIIQRSLPTIRPELEALLQHGLEKIIQQTSAYQNLKFLPGSQQLSTNLSREIVKQFTEIGANSFNALLAESPAFDRILAKLIQKISQSITSEFHNKQSVEKIEYLLIELLEEVKINYIKRLSQEDIETILEETRKIRQKAAIAEQ